MSVSFCVDDILLLSPSVGSL